MFIVLPPHRTCVAQAPGSPPRAAFAWWGGGTLACAFPLHQRPFIRPCAVPHKTPSRIPGASPARAGETEWVRDLLCHCFAEVTTSCSCVPLDTLSANHTPTTPLTHQKTPSPALPAIEDRSANAPSAPDQDVPKAFPGDPAVPATERNLPCWRRPPRNRFA